MLVGSTSLEKCEKLFTRRRMLPTNRTRSHLQDIEDDRWSRHHVRQRVHEPHEGLWSQEAELDRLWIRHAAAVPTSCETVKIEDAPPRPSASHSNFRASWRGPANFLPVLRKKTHELLGKGRTHIIGLLIMHGSSASSPNHALCRTPTPGIGVPMFLAADSALPT